MLFVFLKTHVIANDESKLTRSYETNIFGPNLQGIEKLNSEELRFQIQNMAVE
jgi:hypothetical protein